MSLADLTPGYTFDIEPGRHDTVVIMQKNLRSHHRRGWRLKTEDARTLSRQLQSALSSLKNKRRPQSKITPETDDHDDDHDHT